MKWKTLTSFYKLVLRNYRTYSQGRRNYCLMVTALGHKLHTATKENLWSRYLLEFLNHLAENKIYKLESNPMVKAIYIRKKQYSKQQPSSITSCKIRFGIFTLKSKPGEHHQLLQKLKPGRNKFLCSTQSTSPAPSRMRTHL